MIKHLRLPLKNKAFTLVEVVLALGVSCMGVLLISGILLMLQKQTTKNYQADQIQWQQMLELLHSQELDLMHKKTYQFKGVIFYSPKQDNEYSFVHSSQKVYLKDSNTGGYMPVLYNVSAFNLEYQKPYLKITATMHNQKYQEEVYMVHKEDEKTKN